MIVQHLLKVQFKETKKKCQCTNDTVEDMVRNWIKFSNIFFKVISYLPPKNRVILCALAAQNVFSYQLSRSKHSSADHLYLILLSEGVLFIKTGGDFQTKPSCSNCTKVVQTSCEISVDSRTHVIRFALSSRKYL